MSRRRKVRRQRETLWRLRAGGSRFARFFYLPLEGRLPDLPSPPGFVPPVFVRSETLPHFLSSGEVYVFFMVHPFCCGIRMLS